MSEARPDSAHSIDNARPLAGRHAVVTGGGRGIGRAIALRLADAGARITVMGRSVDQLAAVVAEIGDRNGAGPAQHLGVDVADEDSVARAFGAAGEFAPIDILINNAGIADSAPLKRTTLAQWNAIMAVNLTGVFLCTRAVLPAMTERGFGRIVSVASTAGLKGYAYVAPYCASKHGVIGMTRSLALETARTGVTVNCVCPGYTDSDIVDAAARTIAEKTGRTEEQAKVDISSGNPQKRLIQPEEVAEATLWLCDPRAGSMTGQSVAVAGGEVM
ncbi:SDR family NAD(P)-dependent oxidoreductase [Fodinicurvata sp. EGI_FJ10296]|uniref:SDR family NAD(P)-dependent oxidoreductase n=1 Tax=Fodinicurvata sp. EGI_FJ10296 TaxID=3231908 RepID=UPI00345538ED